MKDDDEVRKYFARTIGDAFLREAYHRDLSARQACFRMHADPAPRDENVLFHLFQGVKNAFIRKNNFNYHRPHFIRVRRFDSLRWPVRSRKFKPRRDDYVYRIVPRNSGRNANLLRRVQKLTR